MEKKDNLHAGHRARVVKKFLEYPQSFSDHEKLEILLYYAVPRIDTNELAHKIMRAFGSLDKVFSASAEELKAVEGVGDKIAALIMLVGTMVEQVEWPKVQRMSSFANVKDYIAEYYKDKLEEESLFFLLDKKHLVITCVKFCDQNRTKVLADIPEISRAISIHKPINALLVHNHSSGNHQPSGEDDLATKKINLICGLYGVNLLDHIIYASGNFYSYHSEGRMEDLKSQADVEKILQQIKENHYGNQN